MCVYLRPKYQVSSIILTVFRQGRAGNPPNPKQAPKNPTQIRLKVLVFILKVRPCLFLTAVFSIFICKSYNLTFTLLYSTVHIIHRIFAVPL